MVELAGTAWSLSWGLDSGFESHPIMQAPAVSKGAAG